MYKAFIICGAPGAGKTTHAKRLANEWSAALLDIDTVTERLVRLALVQSGHSPDDRDSEFFKRTFREPIYETLFDIARENLQAGHVVITGPFTREIRDPEWPATLSHRLGSGIEVHYVQCPPEIRRSRLAKRGNARDRTKLEQWTDYVQYYGDENPPVFEHVKVDGTQ